MQEWNKCQIRNEIFGTQTSITSHKGVTPSAGVCVSMGPNVILVVTKKIE